MDWRHMAELLEAGRSFFGELMNLCVWIKNNGGMGSFYRSRRELVFTFKNGKALTETIFSWAVTDGIEPTSASIPE